MTVPLARPMEFTRNTTDGAGGDLTGRQYKIQHTTNLITPTWLDVGSTLTASGGELTWNGPAPGGTTGFYRIVQIGE